MAFAIGFVMHSTIASLCFWTERASALERFIFIPFLFLSGMIAPLSAFPERVHTLALWTPFPYLIDFPARILANQPVNLVNGFCIQICWLILLLPIMLVTWRLGVRRYSGMGA